MPTSRRPFARRAGTLDVWWVVQARNSMMISFLTVREIDDRGVHAAVVRGDDGAVCAPLERGPRRGFCHTSGAPPPAAARQEPLWLRSVAARANEDAADLRIDAEVHPIAGLDVRLGSGAVYRHVGVEGLLMRNAKNDDAITSTEAAGGVQSAPGPAAPPA